MALVDTSMYRYENPDYFGNFMRGAQFRQQSDAHRAQMEKQKREQEEAQKFDRTLRGLVQVNDTTTPEGRTGLLRDLNQLGYGKQALGLMGQFQEMAPKPVESQWAPLPGAEAPTLYDNRSGAIKVTGVAGKPPAPGAQRNPVFKAGADGFEHEWDPAARKFVRTNLKTPKDGATPRPTGLKPEQVFAMEQQLRNSFQTKTKDFRDVRDAYGRIQVSAKEPSAAGDLALIFNYMKMLDPGSTVRESEFAAAAASGSLGDRFVAAGKKLLSGERLDPTQRADFVKSARDLYGKQFRQYDKTKFETRKMAMAYEGLNPDRILMDDGLADEPGAAPQMATYQQYDALPSGAEFTDPEGNVRRKP